MFAGIVLIMHRTCLSKEVRVIPTLGLLAWALCTGSPSAVAQQHATNRFEVYTLGTADLNSTLQAVQALAGPKGEVISDPVNHRLLVVTSGEQHAQIADLMKKLAVPPRNVLIEVSFDSAESGQAFEASAEGSGGVIFSSDGANGLFSLRPKVLDQTSSHRSSQKQTLLVSSGREGVLRVGERVPYLEWVMDYGWRRGGLLSSQLAWQEVGSFLIVQPTIVGDGPLIRVRITPELRGLVDGRPEHVRFTAVSTEVVIQDGETLPLGGLGGDQQFYDRFLVGISQGGSTQSLNIRLTPHIQPSAQR